MFAHVTSFLAEIQQIQIVKDGGWDWSASAPWIVALLAMLVTLALGAFNYFFNWRIKRMEYLDKLGEELRTDKTLIAATRLLDWEIRTVTIDKVQFHYNVKMLERALVDHATLKPEEGFRPEEVVIRDTFDTFFGFLEKARYAVEIGLLKLEDIFASPMHYYLGKVLEKDEWTGCAVCRFLKAYGFPYTQKLLGEYRDIARFRASSPSYPPGVEADFVARTTAPVVAPGPPAAVTGSDAVSGSG